MLSARRSRRAFFTLVVAQFLSSLADNALLIAAIGLLIDRRAASWMTPALRLVFYLSYVSLGAFAGAVADAYPKSQVILLTNLVKVAGCGLLFAGIHPLVAYGLIGLGAAAYSPAKYGILPELVAQSDLVTANAWIEATTVLSILLGVGLGSLLINSTVITIGRASNAAHAAVGVLCMVYLFASLCSAAIPKGKATNSSALQDPRSLVQEFGRSFRILWHDSESQISLAVTTLFWAASAMLQFVILLWAALALHLNLSDAALLQTAVAIGMVMGAVAAVRWIPLSRALAVLPIGTGIAIAVVAMAFVTRVSVAATLLVVIGTLSGMLLVPMNALLQHRGQLLMHSGQAIAVQNFIESLGSLVLLASYAILLYLDVSLVLIIVVLGLFLMAALLLIMKRHRTNRCEETVAR
ncbi:lysophospholipid transporter LplT [Caballeronia sordidicola]|uniref:Putative transmembrane protein n=1 Tax=Caballeronia sordidicola TaxID=196367 RepID=A0A242N461_CABSO|nr:lysophospholipid transporter LplT [Caballeronia sordidicola]OTP78450.1 putative transmembrane protein [Caballeronia sordidicola]